MFFPHDLDQGKDDFSHLLLNVMLGILGGQ